MMQNINGPIWKYETLLFQKFFLSVRAYLNVLSIFLLSFDVKRSDSIKECSNCNCLK